MNIQLSKDFVLDQARKNIEKVSKDPCYVKQAQQVNASLASIVACERNEVMLEALRRAKGNSTLNLGHAE